MYVADDLWARELLESGTVSVVEASSMYRASPVVRDFVDSLLLELCRQPLGDNGRHAFVSPFHSFIRLTERDRQGVLLRIPQPVSAVLMTAGQGFSRANQFERAQAVLEQLGGPSASARACALALHTRVAAARIRDGITHPAIGARVMRHPALHENDERTYEVAAIVECDLLYRAWCIGSSERQEIEAAIMSLAETISWPSPGQT
ncbi:hypothetical protein [Nocardia farcinica]|uniref:hypothetical protein n=1 Tax=Nocardia farcinica TaxID=37329 RepID=UPI002455117A|nr:hypothetical protein [Nocardia farcinica]